MKDCLDHAILYHRAQVEFVGDVYRWVQSTLPAIGHDPYFPPSAPIDLELAQLVPFFRYLPKELGCIHVALKNVLEKEGVWTAIAIAVRILSGFYHHDPYFPAEPTLEDLTPREHELAMRVMAHYIGAVVHLEKENDFSAG